MDEGRKRAVGKKQPEGKGAEAAGKRELKKLYGKDISTEKYTKKRKTIYTIAGFSLLAAVLAAALFTPQIIFRVQDYLLCRDTVLSQKERLDVEALSTAYEKSLAVRMQNFADALAENEIFYVTSQALEKNDELTRYLYSNAGLYQGNVLMLMDDMEGGLIPSYIGTDVCYVSQWKQYVIYSDNYARGVNFILWYIELQCPGGGQFKLLSDAEDGTIYALRSENIIDTDGHMGYDSYWVYYSWQEYWGTMGLWERYAEYYEAWSEPELFDLSAMMEAYGWESDIADKNTLGMSASETEKLLEMSEQVWNWREDDDSMIFRMPFGEHSLDVRMSVQKPDQEDDGYFSMYPDVTVGVRNIYEKIPEFM